MLESVSKTLMKKMAEERASTGLKNGKLRSILNARFAKFTEDISMNCRRIFEDNNEKELSNTRYYIFYSKKIYKQS